MLAPEIGIYHPQKGEVNTGLRSGIARPHQWHNYAVRFNLPAKQLTVWIDRECRSTIDLAALKDASGRPALAGLSWTGRYVSIGGFSPPDDKRKVWFDNFRVGSPREVGYGNQTTDNDNITNPGGTESQNEMARSRNVPERGAGRRRLASGLVRRVDGPWQPSLDRTLYRRSNKRCVSGGNKFYCLWENLP